MKPRRQFLVKSGVGLVAASVIPLQTLWTRRVNGVASLAELKLTSFQGVVATGFQVQNQSEKVTLTLADVRNHQPAQGEHFTLRFTGSAAQALGQGTYMMEHAELGKFSLMIVPGHTTGQLRGYNAIINRTI